MENLEIAKRAFSIVSDVEPGMPKPELEDLPTWQYLSDDVVWKFSSSERTPLFGAEVRGKNAIMDLVRSERELLETYGADGPVEFISSRDRVVMLGEHSYKIRKNSVDIKGRMFAIVMDFRGGLITRVRFYEDLSEFTEAYRSNCLDKEN